MKSVFYLMKLTQSKVNRIENKFGDLGHVEDKPKAGGPSILDVDR